MRALLSAIIGGPETLVMDEVPDPVPSADEVLIRVKACGVNFPDTLNIEDKYQFRPSRPFSPGGEVAGVVESVGKDVSRIRPGDRVIAWCIWGGMAEKVAAKATNCVPFPEQMPFDEASALIMTSYWPLPRGQVSGRASEASPQSRAVEVLPNRRRFLGRLARDPSDRVRSERA